MGFDPFQKATIDLNVFDVRDDVVDALDAEIRRQADCDLPDSFIIETFVADSNDDGLDSHAVVTFEPIEHDE